MVFRFSVFGFSVWVSESYYCGLQSTACDGILTTRLVSLTIKSLKIIKLLLVVFLLIIISRLTTAAPLMFFVVRPFARAGPHQTINY